MNASQNSHGSIDLNEFVPNQPASGRKTLIQRKQQVEAVHTTSAYIHEAVLTSTETSVPGHENVSQVRHRVGVAEPGAMAGVEQL